MPTIKHMFNNIIEIISSIQAQRKLPSLGACRIAGTYALSISTASGLSHNPPPSYHKAGGFIV